MVSGHDFKGNFDGSDEDVKIQMAEKSSFTSLFDRQPPKISVEIENLRAWAPTPDKKTILHGVSTIFQPGKLIGILGPSGSGKTTFLKCVCNQFSTMEGNIRINGHEKTKQFKRHIGFVMQQDLMFSHLTVFETLLTTAYLRLPQEWSDEEKIERVNKVIKILGLEKCKHTTIGTPMSGGISGGEKKRLNVGNELLVNPSVLILDEPTSGLDSKTAKELIELLQDVASEGRTVICSIHQPSSPVFHKFDNVLLLSEGQIIYDGTSKDSIDYFSKSGVTCPLNYNPADFLLDIAFDQDLIKEKNFVEDQNRIRKEKKSQIEKNVDGENDILKNLLADSSDKWPTDWQYQFRTLTWRAHKQKKGDVITWLETKRWFFICLVVCTVWFQVPREEEHINDYIGLVFFMCVFQTFIAAYAALIQFMGEEPIITRERRTGSYRLSAYYFAKWVAELPVELSYPIVFNLTIYWVTGLNLKITQFIYFMITVLFLTSVASALGTCVATVYKDFRIAQMTLSVFILGSMLLGGFYVKPDNIPDGMKWVKYVSVIRYPYKIFLHIVLHEQNFDCEFPSNYDVCQNPGDTISGEDILDKLGFNEHDLTFDFIILISAFLILPRLIGYYYLNQKLN